MIPLKLSIQNFLSYGPHAQYIDFTPYRLICLSGKNGHGKSALLDALTWAIWGQARKLSANTKPDFGLLRIGQTDMTVALDFIFNDQKYRVKRLFSTKHGKHTTFLDFGTYDKTTDQYRSLTEKTLRKTQEKIENTIGLDFESFINSSFLRQGQANEFSKKLPRDRKDILATILGLNKYEKAKKYALEKIKLITQEREKFNKISEHLLAELKHLPTVTAKLLENSKLITFVIQEEQKNFQEKQQLEMTHLTLLKKQSEKEQGEKEYHAIIKQRTEKEKIFHSLVSEWKTIHKKHILLPHEKKLKEEKQALAGELQIAQKEFQEILEQKEKSLNYKIAEQNRTIVLQKSYEQQLYEKRLTLERLSDEQEAYKKQHNECEKNKTTCENQIKTLEQEINQLHLLTNPTLLITDTATLEKQFERQKKFYLTWIEQGKRSAQELQSLGHKQQLTQSLDNPSCPLCEQNLSLARKRFLSKKFEQQELFFHHRLERIKKVLGQVKIMIEKQKEAITISKKIDALLQTQTATTDQLKKIDLSIKSISEKLTEITKTKTDLQKDFTTFENDIKMYIEHDPEIVQLKQAQKECAGTLQKGAEINEKIRILTKKISSISELLDQWASHTQEHTQQKERKKNIHTHAQVIRTLIAQEKQLKKQISQYDDLASQQKTVSFHEQNYAERIKEFIKIKDAALQEKGRLEAELKKLEQQSIYQKECLQKSMLLQQEIEELQLIAQAFGKDGIQALLIEEAIPEIEHEANDILARLTDNQAHIFIESLRDLKKGGVRETLDINISDASGIRPYELFSGGEAFRIDFSLRIAISKLLARRSGTSLQTLIIDEGFGSQDEEGLVKIMDAIYKIQNDFEKIMIVSHLATMKDQFPVHFTIEKNPQGSRVMIRELG